jgi:hypothetical protein
MKNIWNPLQTCSLLQQKKKEKMKVPDTRLELGAKKFTSAFHSQTPKVSKILEGECLRYENRKFYLLVIRAQR